MLGGASNTTGRERLRKSSNRFGSARTSRGRIFQGNTRIKVLEERGYPVNDLPRDPSHEHE